MATARPSAVSISASEMPAETDDRPPEPVEAMTWEAGDGAHQQPPRAARGNALEGGDDPEDRPEQPDEGCHRADRGENRETPSQVRAHVIEIALHEAPGAVRRRERRDVRSLVRVLVAGKRRLHEAGEVPDLVLFRLVHHGVDHVGAQVTAGLGRESPRFAT